MAVTKWLIRATHHCKSISPSFIKSIIRKFVIKEQRDPEALFLALHFFFLQRRTFSLSMKTAHSRMGAFGSIKQMGKLRPPHSSAPPLSPASLGRERREQQRGQNTCLGG